MVGGAMAVTVAALFGDADGCGMIGVDDAGRFCVWEIAIAPIEHGANRFSGEAFAMRLWREHPADFHQAFEAGFDVAPVFGESRDAEEFAGSFVFDNPIAESEEHPLADVAEVAVPSLFFGKRLAADEARYAWIGPQSVVMGKVFQSMAAQTETGGLDDWNSYAKCVEGVGHGEGKMLVRGCAGEQLAIDLASLLLQQAHRLKPVPLSGSRNRRRSRSRRLRMKA